MAKQQKMQKMRIEKKRTASYWVIAVIIGILALIMFFPVFWMFLCSFKSNAEMLHLPLTFWPKSLNLDNYFNAFKQMPFGTYYLNSVWTSALNTVVGILTSSLVGYVFAKYHFRGRDTLFLVVLACMFIPYETLMPTVYKIMVGFKWTNSYLVLTIPYFVNIFGVFLMRQFFIDLPDDYIEAAEIDGCGQFRTWFSVAMPMARPMIAAMVIYLFMASYNSFMWPLISIDSAKFRTLPVGIATLMWDRGNQYDLLMACSSMIIVPIVIIFACMQKQFIEGMTAGGVKG